MELAINHSKVKSGNGEAKYFVRTGEVIYIGFSINYHVANRNEYGISITRNAA